ncbi:hypothetical protein XENTR_v10017646 [Xenopus tropicalis]|nr:hypothetical protein XENTR_v10017646 [Xenopus tropicalis]
MGLCLFPCTVYVAVALGQGYRASSRWVTIPNGRFRAFLEGMTCLLSISDFPFSRPSGIPLYQWSFPELKPGPIRGYDAGKELFMHFCLFLYSMIHSWLGQYHPRFVLLMIM